MKKKLLSLVLVVAMLASMLMIAPASGAAIAPPSAEPEVPVVPPAPLTVGTVDAIGFVGQTVDVDVVMNSAADVYGFQFGYTYDNSMLRLDGVTWGAAGGSGDYSNKLGPAFKESCAKGPYDVLGQGYADPFAANMDHVIVTLHFTPLAAGTASVGMVAMTAENGLVQNNGEAINQAYLTNDASVYYKGSEIACSGSTVTILPADYAGKGIVTFPDSAWEIDEGYLYGVSEELAAYAGLVVIPSTIGGMTVENIDPNTFEGCSMTAVVIPETVLSIGDLAFHDCVDLTDAYVMNGDCEIGVDALGFAGGTYKRGKYNNDASPVDGFTLHAPAGGATEAYATDSEISFSTDVAAYPLTVNGASYLVGDTATAPGAMKVDGGYAIAWTDGTTTYAPGATMTITGATTLTPVTITAPTMNAGVEFKLGEETADTAMRFSTTLSKAAYDELAKVGKITMGTIITPAKYVSLAGGLTKTALDALSAANGDVQTYIDVPAKSFYKETPTDYTIAGSLIGFKADNLNVAYAAAFYLTVHLDENSSFTIYTDFDLGASRSVNACITAMTNMPEGLTDTEAAALLEWIKGNK